MKSKILRFLACWGICLGAGLLGMIFTTPAIPGWYAGLLKPSFNPPNWIFAPVWNLLYTMMAAALFIVSGTKASHERSWALYTFAVQLILNAVWSVVFFGAHSPLGGLVVIVLLWLAILLTILRFKPISGLAAWLLVPYLLWVSFASLLNFFLWRLNG